jgi:hypothetical protein
VRSSASDEGRSDRPARGLWGRWSHESGIRMLRYFWVGQSIGKRRKKEWRWLRVGPRHVSGVRVERVMIHHVIIGGLVPLLGAVRNLTAFIILRWKSTETLPWVPSIASESTIISADADFLRKTSTTDEGGEHDVCCSMACSTLPGLFQLMKISIRVIFSCDRC